jgi:hypothetical protein
VRDPDRPRDTNEFRAFGHVNRSLGNCVRFCAWIAGHDPSPAGAREQAFHDSLYSVAAMALPGVGLIGGRQAGFKGICSLTTPITTPITTRMAADAFWRVQRFSFRLAGQYLAGSIVRLRVPTPGDSEIRS